MCGNCRRGRYRWFYFGYWKGWGDRNNPENCRTIVIAVPFIDLELHGDNRRFRYTLEEEYYYIELYWITITLFRFSRKKHFNRRVFIPAKGA